MFKTLIILIFLFCFNIASASQSEFCNGYKHGYSTAFKQKKNTSLNPLPPMCPLMPLKGFGDPSSDYEFGYTIGYKDGFKN